MYYVVLSSGQRLQLQYPSLSSLLPKRRCSIDKLKIEIYGIDNQKSRTNTNSPVLVFTIPDPGDIFTQAGLRLC